MKFPAVLAVVTLVSLSFADSEAQARKAIEAKFKSMSAAFAAKDAKGFEAVFADDFSAKAQGGRKMTKAEVFKDFEQQMKFLQHVNWTQDIKEFKLKGNTAEVGFASHMTADAPTQDGKIHKVVLEAKNKNEWVKGQKGWQVHFSETSSMKVTMDGHSFGGGGGRRHQ